MLYEHAGIDGTEAAAGECRLDKRLKLPGNVIPQIATKSGHDRATDVKRLRVHHGKSVYGRLFIQFCAQVLRTSLRNSIADFPSEVKKYASSVDALLSRVRSYSKVTYKGRYGSQYTVMTKGQKLIFSSLGIADCEQEEDSTENLLS